MSKVKIRMGSDGRLLVMRGAEEIGVKLRQCFPWSEPHAHLSLRNDEDQEIAFVEDPAALEPESRDALDGALAVAGFVLDVVRVLDIEEEVEIRQWVVET